MVSSKILRLRHLLRRLFVWVERTDYSAYDVAPSFKLPVYGVYHIFCVNDWMSLLKEQIGALKESGLWDITAKLYVSCIVSSEKDVTLIQEVIGHKCSVIHVTSDKSVFEYPALDFIRCKAENEDALFYYFHTKGISYRELSPTQIDKNVNAWRKMMEYFIFTKYNVAMNVLSEYDTYGCYYNEIIGTPVLHRYYSGNFWWSKSSYIRKIPQLKVSDYRNRYGAENWLCQKATKVFIAFNTSAELYDTQIPAFFYDSSVPFRLGEMMCFLFCHYKYIGHRLLALMKRK